MSDEPRDPSCLFCRIVAGEVPSDVVADGERTYAFRDISPAAPTHVLVVPKAHYADVVALAAGEPDALAELALVAGTVADGGPFRLIFNTGEGAGQTVGHVHGHVMAGRGFTWPPG